MVNVAEVQLVGTLVRELRVRDVPTTSIGVITPYRAQARALQHATGSLVDVSTVDKYQGRDKQCIIVSLVLSSAQCDAGRLLGDWRRINVAMTRAKSKLVVVGSASTVAGAPALAAFLELAQQNNWLQSIAFQDLQK